MDVFTLAQNTSVASFREPVINSFQPAVLSAGLSVTFLPNASVVTSAHFVFGGTSMKKIRIAKSTAATVVGRLALIS